MGNTITEGSASTKSISGGTTLIDVANNALSEIGQNRITALDDNTREAKAVNSIMDITINEVLAAHRWNGPSKRAKLAQLSTDPEFEFDHAYQLPTDYVRLNYTEAPEETYKIEGGRILSDEDELHISYVAFTRDPNTMGRHCTLALTYRLAAKLTQALTGDASRYQMMMERYEQTLAEARYQDSQQEGIQRIGGTSWLDARHSGTTRDTSRLHVGESV